MLIKKLPYVYKLIHKETGKFYIGSRTSKAIDNLPEIDIALYKSSSSVVKSMGFENFDVEILAIFFDPLEAYKFEQLLIHENFNDPNIINNVCHHDKKEFRNTTKTSGSTGMHHMHNVTLNKSIMVTKERVSIFEMQGYRLGQSDIHNQRLRDSITGRTLSLETKKKMSITRKNKPKSDSHKNNIAKAMKGKNSYEHSKEQRLRESKGKLNKKFMKHLNLPNKYVNIDEIVSYMQLGYWLVDKKFTIKKS